MSIELYRQNDDLKSYDDWFFREESLPNNTSTTSDELRSNDGLAGIEIVGVAETDLSAASLVVELLHSDTSEDSSPTAETLYSSSAGASEGDELFRFAPDRNIGACPKWKSKVQSFRVC